MSVPRELAVTSQVVELPKEPTGDQFEHLAAALLAVGGFFVEKNIHERVERRDLQELDVCAWRWQDNGPQRLVVEVKSGAWHKSDLFSILGKRIYLGCDGGLLVHKKQDDPDPVYSAVIERLRPFEVEAVLLDPMLPDDDLAELIADLCAQPSDAVNERVSVLHSLPAWRYSFWIEKMLIRALRAGARDAQAESCRGEVKSLLELIHNRFFISDCREQSLLLWQHYQDHPKATRRLINELLESGDHEELNGCSKNNAYAKCVFDGELPLVQACLYLESWSRCLILRAAVEMALLRETGQLPDADTRGFSLDDILPEYFDDFAQFVKSIECAERLPQLWQAYIFAWGGFLIEESAEAEELALARDVGMPLESVRKGLQAFDYLFPGLQGGWHSTIRDTGLRVLKVVPSPFRGLGVQRRRWMQGDEVFRQLPQKGGEDCVKWSNSAIRILTGDH